MKLSPVSSRVASLLALSLVGALSPLPRLSGADGPTATPGFPPDVPPPLAGPEDFQPNPAADARDLATLKARLVELYARERRWSATAVQRSLATLGADGAWPDLAYRRDQPVGSDWQEHFMRVVQLALVHRATGAPEPLEAARRALHRALERDPVTEHKWFNQIGVPREVTKVLFLLGHELSAQEIAGGLRILRKGHVRDGYDYSGSPATGQNLTWVARLQLEAGVLCGDPAEVNQAAGRLAWEIRRTTDEGIQHDGSFHQHGPQLYSGGYGLGFALDNAILAGLTAGTRFALPPERLTILAEHILDGQRWMTRGREWDFTVQGREVSRPNADAGGLIPACETLAALDAAARGAEFREFAARLGRDPATAGDLVLEPEPTGDRHFWRSDYHVHHRPGYHFGVKMASRRVSATETGNGEGLKNHHLGDGAVCLMRTGQEFHGIYPLWDWRRLPGVTCAAGEGALPQHVWGANSRGETDFVGGVSDGEFGLAAMDWRRDGVSARKAWFCLGREIVCLGSGIGAGEEVGFPVQTTLNQCWAKGPTLATAGNAAARPVNAGTTMLPAARWVHHDGVGYFFPAPTDVRLAREARRATWAEITTNSAERAATPAAGDVWTLWLEHGARPRNAAYAYSLLPGVSAAEMAAYAGGDGDHEATTSRRPRVLANGPAQQAVLDPVGGRLQAAFYEAGALTLPDGGTVAVNHPCLLMVGVEDGRPAGRVWASNPRNGPLELEVTFTPRPGAPVGGKTVRLNLLGGAEGGRSVGADLSGR